MRARKVSYCPGSKAKAAARGGGTVKASDTASRVSRLRSLIVRRWKRGLERGAVMGSIEAFAEMHKHRRHGRAWPGHPRLPLRRAGGVDGRTKCGHDEARAFATILRGSNGI